MIVQKLGSGSVQHLDSKLDKMMVGQKVLCLAYCSELYSVQPLVRLLD